MSETPECRRMNRPDLTNGKQGKSARISLALGSKIVFEVVLDCIGGRFCPVGNA
jgi:hypothetical protein